MELDSSLPRALVCSFGGQLCVATAQRLFLHSIHCFGWKIVVPFSVAGLAILLLKTKHIQESLDRAVASNYKHADDIGIKQGEDSSSVALLPKMMKFLSDRSFQKISRSQKECSCGYLDFC